MSPLIHAWLLTVAVEVPVVAALGRPQRLRLGLACAVATSLTNLAMNGLWFPAVGPTYFALATAEVAAVALEAAFYFAVAPERGVGRSLRASFLANIASLGAGLLSG